ncbi:type III effector protein [Microvirga sp. KLBC 81]|uniref:Hsp20/alpha crystallin family protein n=1 Tax=Microvirga sp. KLBC 81 TaxID=1862707 RepID=UPI000D512351|nr:Hsp20/alpha crystallin family protein [Microvirga sp. KLBC 81]PVE21094.1 type III effector protein [Microvirga sp. KLBC 81]
MARNPLTPFRSGFGLLGGSDPFLSLHREMNRLFDDVLRGGGMMRGGGQGTAGSMMSPQINVSETDNEIRVSAELPGVSENDIQVDLNDDVLTIRGEKRFEHADERENFHFLERSYGTFQRTLQLPFSVDPNKVQASFENGVLTVILPKSAQQERSHRIQVNAGGRGQIGGQSKASAQEGQGSEESQGKKEGKSGKGGSGTKAA